MAFFVFLFTMKATLVHIIENTPTMLQKLFCGIILIADSRPTFFEKIKYFGLIISTLTPVVWLIESLSGWYLTNQQFANCIFITIIFNLIIGCWYHHKMGTFSYEQFIFRNAVMIAVIIFGYTMLEMLKIRMGDNMLAQGFGITIEISTLLYPGSKVLKNLYILSNKQFPPAFIMERLYNFEKSGNLKDLLPNDEPKNQ